MQTADFLARLQAVFDSARPAAVAVSGGVDSMTLAYVAHRAMGGDVTMFHASSPAVPQAATARIRDYAARQGWQLRIVDAGEFSDEQYLSNPTNRCFFCKSNLYGTLAGHTDAQLFSGTNMDDLAEMPSAPCLSSRIETALRIDPDMLRAVDRIETLLRAELAPETVRCRVRAAGVVIELDPGALSRLSPERQQALAGEIRAAFGSDQPVLFQSYTRGSAFLREQTE